MPRAMKVVILAETSAHEELARDAREKGFSCFTTNQASEAHEYLARHKPRLAVVHWSIAERQFDFSKIPRELRYYLPSKFTPAAKHEFMLQPPSHLPARVRTKLQTAAAGAITRQGTSGIEVAARMLRENPRLHVIIITGANYERFKQSRHYTALNEDERHRMHYVMKPYFASLFGSHLPPGVRTSRKPSLLNE